MQNPSELERNLWAGPPGEVLSLHQVLTQRPELLAKYHAFIQTLYRSDVLPRRVLELMRVKIASIHGLTIDLNALDPRAEIDHTDILALKADEMGRFDSGECIALSAAELMPMQPHALTDELVTQVADVFGPKGCVMLLVAAAFFDVNIRLSIVFGQQPEISTFNLDKVH